MTRRIWLIATIALLAGCGDDDGAASPVSTSTSAGPATTHTTLVAAATTPTTTTTTTMRASTTVPRPETSAATTVAAPAKSGAACSGPPAFDLDGPLREQFVDYLVACGFTQPEAACLFDHLDFEDSAVLAGDPGAMTPAFETCQIDLDRMAEIGEA